MFALVDAVSVVSFIRSPRYKQIFIVHILLTESFSFGTTPCVLSSIVNDKCLNGMSSNSNDLQHYLFFTSLASVCC